MKKMGKRQSKTKAAHTPQEKVIDLEKTLQLYLNEKDEYQEKHESCNGQYLQVKSELEKALKTVKSLQRQLTVSEKNATSLYRRYAIETDLNRRLNESHEKLKQENKRLEKSLRHSTTFCTNADQVRRLDKFDERISLIEFTLRDVL